MSWTFWKKVRYGLPTRTSSSKEVNLGELVEFLEQNPDKMYVFPSKDGALVWSSRHGCVICVTGDFAGDQVWCNFELAHQISAMDKAGQWPSSS